MFLAVDIGNTNITAGVFNGDKLLETFRLISSFSNSDYYNKFFSDIANKYVVKNCAIASVVDGLDSLVKSSVENIFLIEPLIIKSSSKTGIKITLPKPESMGIDRIANIACAMTEYNPPFVVVDIGTAITIDIADKNGCFSGGIIMPGINMQLKALSDNTSKLPRIEIDKIPNAVGYDTKSAILSGVVRGSACAISGLIDEFEQELGYELKTIITGGQAEFLSEYMSRKGDVVTKDLTLQGIRILYNLNR